ncbi:helix-turn-helix domain-containing protein [archaeon]|nr:MAG: helix-turn-helix domain-containing protein [archaeon]
MTQSATHDYIHHTRIISYYKLPFTFMGITTMAPTLTRSYHRVGEDKRIQIITLQEQRYTPREISKKTKVKKDIVPAVLRKWKQLHTIRDLPKTGRPVKVDAHTRRRLARMVQSGEVSTAPELALTAASHDLVHVSTSTASRVLHQEGLKAIQYRPEVNLDCYFSVFLTHDLTQAIPPYPYDIGFPGPYI